VEKGIQNPNHLASIEQAQFSKLSPCQKKSLLKAFFKCRNPTSIMLKELFISLFFHFDSRHFA
jgi:hypothetical protein